MNHDIAMHMASLLNHADIHVHVCGFMEIIIIRIIRIRVIRIRKWTNRDFATHPFCTLEVSTTHAGGIHVATFASTRGPQVCLYKC